MCPRQVSSDVTASNPPPSALCPGRARGATGPCSNASIQIPSFSSAFETGLVVFRLNTFLPENLEASCCLQKVDSFLIAPPHAYWHRFLASIPIRRPRILLPRQVRHPKKVGDLDAHLFQIRGRREESCRVALLWEDARSAEAVLGRWRRKPQPCQKVSSLPKTGQWSHFDMS